MKTSGVARLTRRFDSTARMLLGSDKRIRRCATKSLNRRSSAPMILRIAAQLERTVLLDQPNARLAHVARDDPGESAAQVDGQVAHRLVAVQLRACHRRVRRLERQLEVDADVQVPSCRSTGCRCCARSARTSSRPRMTSRGDRPGSREHRPCSALRDWTERVADERVQTLEIVFARCGAR